jgi:hypothetical protein
MIKNINESRIRELRRKILHEHNQMIRNIYREHIIYLESQN